MSASTAAVVASVIVPASNDPSLTACTTVTTHGAHGADDGQRVDDLALRGGHAARSLCSTDSGNGGTRSPTCSATCFNTPTFHSFIASSTTSRRRASHLVDQAWLAVLLVDAVDRLVRRLRGAVLQSHADQDDRLRDEHATEPHAAGEIASITPPSRATRRVLTHLADPPEDPIRGTVAASSLWPTTIGRCCTRPAHSRHPNR